MNRNGEKNSSLPGRIAEAKKYQLLAFQALLPETAAEHFDVFRRELTALLMDCIWEGFAERNQRNTCDGMEEGTFAEKQEARERNHNNESGKSKVKKVSIE